MLTHVISCFAQPPNIRKLQHQMTINKKSKTRERQMTKAIKSTKQKRKEKADAAGVTPNFPALQLLHDPQSFGEKLYDGLSRHGQSSFSRFCIRSEVDLILVHYH